jgi:methionyl-tRNA formyltransferase
MTEAGGETIIVFATRDVGRDCLAALIASGSPVARVFATRPDDADILDLARAHGIPAAVATAETQAGMIAAGRRADWLLNLWGNRIFSRPFLGLFRHTLNIHPALVPSCRGADTATWTLRDGAVPGVSLIEIGAGIDDGAIYARRDVPPRFPETAGALQERLKAAAVALFADRWGDIRAGRMTPRAQDGEATSHRRRDTVADRRRRWEAPMTVGEVVTWALAHDFAPDTTAEIERDGRVFRLRVTVEPAG